ncbi:MAG: hypothetical protein HYZ81_15430 [Nitrospinae bacterium]|nr:hypothetical protein [Nitrospinota bacterium]
MADATPAIGLLSPLYTVIERLTLVAPLGLRFWDEVSGRAIGDGLLVTTYAETRPSRRVPALSNRSGIYVLHRIPGVQEFANGTGDQAFWADHPPRWARIVEVVDSARRFQPFQLRLLLPVRGVYDQPPDPAGSPPATAPGIPLYSAPNRTVPAAMAVLRADLWDPRGGPDHTGSPAAWVVLTAHVPGRPGVRGIADAQGRVALIFAYPEPVTNVLASPPIASPLSPPAGGTSLREQAWVLTLEAAYAPWDPVPAVPNLDDLLAQPPAQLWDDFERTELTQATLRFGHELIVHSRDARGAPRSELFITPAGSPR